MDILLWLMSLGVCFLGAACIRLLVRSLTSTKEKSHQKASVGKDAHLTIANVDASHPVVNSRPIIGVVTERLDKDSLGGSSSPDTHDPFIPASYVKWVESAGARVVPILINQNDDYYEKMFQSVNGLLFPGGDVSLENSEFARIGRLMLKLAVKDAESGGYFPVWGTCLGFELINRIMASDSKIISKCDAEGMSLSLDMSPDYRNSRLFGTACPEIIDILQSKDVTSNSHHYCVTTTDFDKYGMAERFRILSTSKDPSGKVFVSTMEGREYPIYGVQFHPEKNNFEWQHRKGIVHSADAVLISQFFANFFVSEARRNNHRFSSQEEENEALIYNWSPVFTKDTDFDQVYVFRSDHKERT